MKPISHTPWVTPMGHPVTTMGHRVTDGVVEGGVAASRHQLGSPRGGRGGRGGCMAHTPWALVLVQPP
jgi:hypothetical protein